MIRSLVTTVLLAAVLPSLSQEARTEIARQPLPPMLRTRAPATEPERKAETIPSPSSPEAASEFGEQVVLVRQAQWDPWRADASVSAFYTDNVALAPHRVDDWFMKYDVAVGYTNRIEGPWTLDANLTQSFVRYDQFDALDFDLLRAEAGVSYEADWLWDASVFARYSFYRITGPGYGKELLHQHSISVGVQKVWKVSQGQQLFAGIATEPSLEAVPSVAQRNEHSAFGGWAVQLTDDLSAQLGGRIGYHVSEHTDRSDWNYVAMAGVNYALTGWARIGVNGSIAWNESNKSVFTYRNAIAGVFVGVNINF